MPFRLDYIRYNAWRWHRTPADPNPMPRINLLRRPCTTTNNPSETEAGKTEPSGLQSFLYGLRSSSGQATRN